MAGYIALWNKYGKAKWNDIVSPSIPLAESSNVSAILASKLEDQEEYILSSPGLSSVFAPEGTILKEGDLLLQPALASSLRVLADNPYDYYNGSIAQGIVNDVQSAGGILTMEDMIKYMNEGVHFRNCTEIYYRGMKVLSSPFLPLLLYYFTPLLPIIFYFYFIDY